MGYPIGGFTKQGYLQVACFGLQDLFCFCLPPSLLPFSLLGNLLFHSRRIEWDNYARTQIAWSSNVVIFGAGLLLTPSSMSNLPLGAANSAGGVQHANRTQGELRMFRCKPFLARGLEHSVSVIGGISGYCIFIVYYLCTFRTRGWE